MENSSKILDLGCGKNKVKDVIGIDNVALEGVDIIHDLRNFPYPFEDNSIDKVYCRHILEHFDVDTRNKILEEIHRILKTDGQLEIRVPHAFSIGAFLDPTHKSFFTFNTLDYFTKHHPLSYYSDCHFKIIKKCANVNLSYSSQSYSKLRGELKFTTESVCAKILNKVFRVSDTLPDLLVKILPFYTVEIFWVLSKD